MTYFFNGFVSKFGVAGSMGRPRKAPPVESKGSDPNVVLAMVGKARALVEAAAVKRKSESLDTCTPAKAKAKTAVPPRPPATPQNEPEECSQPPEAKAKLNQGAAPKSASPIPAQVAMVPAKAPAKATSAVPPPVVLPNPVQPPPQRRHSFKSHPDPVQPEADKPAESTASQRVKEALEKAKAMRLAVAQSKCSQPTVSSTTPKSSPPAPDKTHENSVKTAPVVTAASALNNPAATTSQDPTCKSNNGLQNQPAQPTAVKAAAKAPAIPATANVERVAVKASATDPETPATAKAGGASPNNFVTPPAKKAPPTPQSTPPAEVEVKKSLSYDDSWPYQDEEPTGGCSQKWYFGSRGESWWGPSYRYDLPSWTNPGYQHDAWGANKWNWSDRSYSWQSHYDEDAEALRNALGRQPTQLSLGASTARDSTHDDEKLDDIEAPATPTQETSPQQAKPPAAGQAEEQPDDDVPNAAAEDPMAWRKDKAGNIISPHALYMRFYRSLRSSWSAQFISIKKRIIKNTCGILQWVACLLSRTF